MKNPFAGDSAERKNALRSAGVFLAVTLASAALSLFLVDNFSVLSRVDQFVQDWETASVFAPHEAQDSDIIIVAVDEATLTRFAYRSPVDRQFLSTLIQQLAAHHPAVIESDFLLDQPTEQAKDVALAHTLRDPRSTRWWSVISPASRRDARAESVRGCDRAAGREGAGQSAHRPVRHGPLCLSGPCCGWPLYCKCCARRRRQAWRQDAACGSADHLAWTPRTD